MDAGEVEPDHGGQFVDQAIDLDEPHPQRVEQPVDGGMQEQPELVSRKRVAAQAVGEKEPAD